MLPQVSALDAQVSDLQAQLETANGGCQEYGHGAWEHVVGVGRWGAARWQAGGVQLSGSRDQRVGMGFLGDEERIKQRVGKAQGQGFCCKLTCPAVVTILAVAHVPSSPYGVVLLYN